MIPKVDDFEMIRDGKPIHLHTLGNRTGMTVCLTNYGARIVSILTPDSSGTMGNVVLGYARILDYLHSNEPYLGATIGRVANRIAKGRFSLNDEHVDLICNNPPNHLHGGPLGFHQSVWDVSESDGTSIVFRLLALEELDDYPGNLQTEVRYTLNDVGELKIDYSASTDKTTIVNLTNHAYFNLSGTGGGCVASHEITLFADYYTPVDESMIPTGQLLHVDGGAFDLRESTPMGRHWDDLDPQILVAGGYDHNFVLNKCRKSDLQLAARVVDPSSKRILEVLTTEPGIQFYTGNSLPMVPRTAFCLETQHFPDSPNQDRFPSILLEPGDTYKSTTIYRFLTEYGSDPGTAQSAHRSRLV